MTNRTASLRPCPACAVCAPTIPISPSSISLAVPSVRHGDPAQDWRPTRPSTPEISTALAEASVPIPRAPRVPADLASVPLYLRRDEWIAAEGGWL